MPVMYVKKAMTDRQDSWWWHIPCWHSIER